ncbi:dTDP-4-dehydrorhamnose reductase [Cetobacterium ceti]
MILITGGRGQLAFEFKRLFDELGVEYTSTTREELDITDFQNIREYFKYKNPKVIINCAAYNSVDTAEEEEAHCYRANAYGPRELALAAKEIDAQFVNFSTGFVFDGKKKIPYIEEDETNPIGMYGASKELGERLVLEAWEKSLVIRTSWVYGKGGPNNFVKSIMEWSKSNDYIKIVDDQISTPTYARDLARYTWDLINKNIYGLYHITNGGEVSKYDFAKYVLDAIGWMGILDRGKTREFCSMAERPENSVLSVKKVEKVLKEKIPSWEDGLMRFLREV